MENSSNKMEGRFSPWGLIALALLALLAVGGALFFSGSRPAPLTIALPPTAAGLPATNAATPVLAVPANAAPVIIRTIELTNFYSCGLTNSISMGAMKNHPNNLGEFPAGEAEYGGMLFAVRGMVQLGATYARQCRGIPIGAPVRALHLLHGTAGLTDDGTEIAQLVIHYADGETNRVAINYGDHVRDWWKWKKTESPEVGPDSELAWTGSNPFARSKNVELRVFRSTFANPFPEKVVASIDYVRTGGTSCTPFLLGLTIQEEPTEPKAASPPATPK